MAGDRSRPCARGLLPNGGLTVAALLADKLGIADLVDNHVTIDGEAGANGGAKAAP